MKKTLAALGLLALSAGTALAGELPPAAASGWTGFYLNAGGGYGMWTADTTTLAASGACVLCVTQTQSGKGWFGTVGGGYDYQFSAPIGPWRPQLIAGLFADGNFGSLSGTIQDQSPYLVGTTAEKWSWAAGARLGWLPTPQMLSYVNGGFTQGHFGGASMAFTGAASGFPAGTSSGFSTQSATLNGWFVGSGIETTLAPILPAGWFLRTEYRYSYYNGTNLSDTCAAGCLPVVSPVAPTITFRPSVQTVTTEIVYRFNSPGMEPAAAPLAYKAAPLPVPAYNWTGFYVNGGGGYGMWNADTTTLSPATGACLLCATQTQGGSGWFGTVGGGFDYQFRVPIGQWSPHVLAGVFADADLSSIRGTIQDQNPFFAGTMTENVAWAAGVRAGWLPTPQIMSYVNGGFTQAHFNGAGLVTTGAFGGFPAGTASGFSTPAVTMNGWFLGSGFETTLAPILPAGWFLRSEYRYAYYGTANLPETCTAGCLSPGGPAGSTITFHPNVQTISASLVYKFNLFGGR